MLKLTRLALFACVAVALLCAAAFNGAQDAPAQPLETETRSGVALAAKSTPVVVEAKGYGGELKLKSIVAPGTIVKVGDVIATVEAPDWAEELQGVQAWVQISKSKAAWCEHSLNWEAKSQDTRLQRAKLNFEAAQSAYDVFTGGGKQERITNADLGVQYNKDSIEDQEDELRQLDALYKGNDLAKESQDIVLKRAKRRLEQSRVRMKLVQSDYDRLIKIELPREEQNLKLNLENAKLDFDSASERGKNGLSEWQGQCIGARQELDNANKRAQKLLALKESWEIKAPHAGTVLHAGDAGADGITATFSAGQKIANGQAIVSIVDTSTLRITVGIDPRAVRIAKMQRNTCKVEVTDLGISLEARVVGIASIVRDDKVTVVFEVAPGESGLMHGQKVSVILSAKK
jgi:biotin carboxyl carrier protein